MKLLNKITTHILRIVGWILLIAVRFGNHYGYEEAVAAAPRPTLAAIWAWLLGETRRTGTDLSASTEILTEFPSRSCSVTVAMSPILTLSPMRIFKTSIPVPWAVSI
jgi:hypothetical protein